MKINTLRNFMLFGVFALPLAANAAAPVPFGSSFTTLNGSVDTYTCPTGFTCGTNPIVDDGFMQVTLTDDANGQTYFQTIVLGGSTEGPDETFSTESFVKVNADGGTNDGIAVDQIVDDLRGGNPGTLESTNVILTGSFLEAGESTVVLTQDVTDAFSGVPADAGFTTGFTFDAVVADLDGGIGGVNDRIATVGLTQTLQEYTDAAQTNLSFDDRFGFASITEDRTDAGGTTISTVTAKAVDIQTKVNLGTGIDDQVFDYDFRSGDYVTTAGNGVVGGNTVDWVAGDSIDRVLITQTVDNAGDFGFASLANRSDIVLEGVNNTNFGSAFTLVSPVSAIDYGTDADPFL